MVIKRAEHLVGSDTDWEQKNPLLSEGDLGIDMTNLLIKVGNGRDRWNSLPYAGATLEDGFIDGGGA